MRVTSVRRVIQNYGIRWVQKSLLPRLYDSDERKLIVFLTPGWDAVSGGIMSIASLFQETLRHRDLHESEVVLCTIPGNPPLLRYTRFPNNNIVFDFFEVLRYFRRLRELLIHIPEYCLGEFLENLPEAVLKRLKRLDDLHFNVLIQNIQLLQSRPKFQALGEVGRVTCTTAHHQYSTKRVRQKVGYPLHELSAFVSPELYTRTRYSEKSNLMVVSHDTHPMKAEVLRMVSERHPSMAVKVIENMRYEEYRQIVSRARWALTFGEGLDGYFVETVFSGGVSFAVYNPDFFTPEFKGLKTVYDDYGTLKANLSEDIEDLEEPDAFSSYQEALYQTCSSRYLYGKYLRNLRRFYEGRYTFS